MSVERHIKLKSLLMQQLVRLHERSGFSSIDFPTDFVSTRLDTLLKSGAVKDSDIRDLAVEARNYASEKAVTELKKSTVNKQSRGDNASQVSSTVSRHTGGSNRNASSAPGSSKVRQQLSQKVDLWAQLVHEDVLAYDKEQMALRAEQRKRMHDQRGALDAQINSMNAKKESQVEQEKLFATQQQKQLEQWMQDTKTAEAAKKEQLELEKRIRDEQMQSTADRKSKESDVRRREDEAVLKKIQLDTQHDLQLQSKKREDAKAEMKKFSEFNALQKQVKLQKQLEEVEVDKKHQQLYLQKLEKQEQEREEALRKLYERQTKHTVMATKMTAGMNERSKQDELRAAAEQERIRSREASIEQRKKEKIEEDKAKLKQYLAMQVRDKDRQRVLQREAVQAERRLVISEMEEADEKEKARKAALRNKETLYRQQVEAQMRDRQQDTNIRGMTLQEHRLNAKRLEKLEDQSLSQSQRET